VVRGRGDDAARARAARGPGDHPGRGRADRRVDRDRRATPSRSARWAGVRADRRLRAQELALPRARRSREEGGGRVRGGRVAALVFVGVGVAVVARTAQLGVGGGLGLVFGGLLVLAGGLRIYLSRR